MIPKNISKGHILKAIKEIERNGIPKRRGSKKFQLFYDGECYPPKYVVSLANEYANDVKLESSEFGAGQETNGFLKKLGFEVLEASPLGVSARPSPAPRKSSERKGLRHDERCPACKKTIETMLRKIYGGVEVNYKFEAGTRPEDYGDSPFHSKLKEIFSELRDHRGHEDFIRSQTLPRCDFFVPDPGFIVEFDESQHFTVPRKLSLQCYPNGLKLGFSKEKWIRLCDEIRARDNDPPFRDEQRAWYDTLRDFLPEMKGLSPTVRLYSNAMRWCSLDPNEPNDLEKFRNLIDCRRAGLKNDWVATVIVESDRKYSNDKRRKVLLEIINRVVKETEGDGVILFPGGYYSANENEASTLFDSVETEISHELRKIEEKIIICLGIDGRVAEYPRDQITVAISKNGIEALGRKFHQAPPERGHIDPAENYLSKEEGRSRIFSLNGRRYFLAACYDSFGIRKLALPNPGVDIILDLVHGFKPRGEGFSGDPYFAKFGFAGASKQWNNHVFGAAVFFNRKIHKNWPSGVYWNQGDKDIKKWKYKDNPIKQRKRVCIKIPEGKALVRIYDLGM